MKKTICLLPFLFFVFSGIGQVMDTAAVIKTIDSLIAVSQIPLKKAAFKEALETAEAANHLAETKLGNKHFKYADCQHNIGAIYLEAAQYDKAEVPLKKGLEIRGELFGIGHIAYSTSLNSLGILYARAGRFDDAERIFLEARSINEKKYGLKHFNYAMGLQNLATIYKNTSRFEEAEGTYRTALAIFKDTIGDNHPMYGMVAMNMGLCMMEQGRYDEAEAVFLKTLQSSEKSYTKNHPYYLLPLQNLAVLYSNSNRYREALQHIEAAKTISIALFGKDNPTEGELCNTAGLCYKSIGDYANAEKEFLQCRDIILGKYGKEHYQYAQSIGNLALLYASQGRYREALHSFNEALALLESSGQKNSPSYVILKIGAGKMFEQLGDHTSGQSNFLQALEIFELIKAEKRVEYEEGVFELAKSYFHQNSVSLAAAEFQKLVDLMQNSTLRATRHYSEKDLLMLQAVKEQEKRYFFSFCLAFPGAELNDQGYNLTLLTKHLLLENKLGIRRALNAADNTIRGDYSRWIGFQRRIATEYVKPVEERKNLVMMESIADSLERNLARNLGGFGNVLRLFSWRDIQSALQPHEAALEFIHFNYYNPEATDSVLYAALLLKPGMPHPLFIPLCEEKQIKVLLPAAGVNINRDQVNELYGINTGDTKNALYHLLWAPLEKHLSGVRTVYYSPSGLLHRINLSALPVSAQSTLSGRHDLVVLGSTRQLVAESRNTALVGSSAALVYGGIQFNMDSTAYPVQTAGNTGGERGLSFSQTDSTLRGDLWNYLKWSEKEVDNVRAALEQAGQKTVVLKGWQATEESFKQIGQTGPSPRILHVSTHGYFFPDPQSVPRPRDNPQSAIRNPQSDEPVFKLSEHPMIRSGLILAGANHAWQTGRPLGNREDGVLTAYEISQLDLRNTELVVLSACETGLGHIEGNEGVYGLQRAFKIAGAKTLVMSLWQVPDYQTQELMTAFYQKWLSGKMPVRQALHAAQKEMRDKGYEPFFWAGFVVVE